MKIEKIYWVDSRSDDKWTCRENINLEITEIETVGFVVEETENVLCIASSFDSCTDQFMGILYIPKVSIVSRE